jgi:hypothetical protein
MKNSLVLLLLMIVIAASSGTTYVLLPAHTQTSTSYSTATIAVTTPITTTLSYSVSSNNPSVESSSDSHSSATCVILGQPGGLILKILSDLTSQPVKNADVSAIATGSEACNGISSTTQSSIQFETNGTSSYDLPTSDFYSYSFVIKYSNQDFRFNATLSPILTTCATLYVPSGKTNVTTMTSC